MKSTSRTLATSLLLLLMNDMCSPFVLGPSSMSARCIMTTFPQGLAPPVIQCPPTVKSKRRNHALTHRRQGKALSLLLAQDGLQPTNLQSLEQKIDELTEQLKNEPNEMLEEEASKLELELRQTIATLTRKLQEAETELRKFKDLQVIMANERAALEVEIAELKKEFEKGSDWQGKYKEALEKQGQERAEAKKEIERLQQEVRIVFSIGRRTSDKTVEALQTMLEEKEERLSMTLEEMSSANERLAEFEEERRSLRKLWGLSLRLASQRLRRRLNDLRKKIFGGILPAVDTKEIEEAKEQALQVRKTRSRS